MTVHHERQIVATAFAAAVLVILIEVVGLLSVINDHPVSEGRSSTPLGITIHERKQ